MTSYTSKPIYNRDSSGFVIENNGNFYMGEGLYEESTRVVKIPQKWYDEWTEKYQKETH